MKKCKAKSIHSWDGGQGQRKGPGGSEGQECQLHTLLVSKKQRGQVQGPKRLSQQGHPAGPSGLQGSGALGPSVGLKPISSLSILSALRLYGMRDPHGPGWVGSEGRV